MTKKEEGQLAEALHSAWKRYSALFGESPHGTLPQMRALVHLLPKAAPEEPPLPAPAPSPQCPKCGYTKEDSAKWLDHHLCDGTIPETLESPERKEERRDCRACHLFGEGDTCLSCGKKRK